MTELDSDVAKFYAEHAAGGPTHVVMAIATLKDDVVRCEVFSTLENACTWSNALSENHVRGCVFSPHIIDVPEYGNVPEGERQ